MTTVAAHSEPESIIDLERAEARAEWVATEPDDLPTQLETSDIPTWDDLADDDDLDDSDVDDSGWQDDGRWDDD